MLWCYRLADGQSHLARNIFEEARRTDRLSWSFDTRVASIIDRNGSVEVVTDKGSFKALKVVSTLPQNVAAKVRFDPPLSPLKQEAFSIQHVGQGHKLHSFFNKPELRSGVWNAWHENPDKTYELAAAFGDHTMRDGRVSVVSFGGGNSKKKLPSHDPSKIPTWLADIDPIFAETYSGSIWHEWQIPRSFPALEFSALTVLLLAGSTTSLRKVTGICIRPTITRASTRSCKSRMAISSSHPL